MILLTVTQPPGGVAVNVSSAIVARVTATPAV